MNLNAAPQNISYQAERMTNEIENISNKILEKYFENRDYNKDKIEVWKDYALEEISNYLNYNYYNYGFVISFNAIKLGNITETNLINRYNTDNYVTVSIQTNTMFCILTIIFYKIEYSKFDLLNKIKENMIMKMNEILTNNLKGKSYSCYDLKQDSKSIVQESDEFFKNKIYPNPCSCLICSIIEQPIEYLFDYKVINFEYVPLITSYSNDSLYGRLIVILLNN